MVSSGIHLLVALSIIFTISLRPCYCQNLTVQGNGFAPAKATWYGDPQGAGSTGGACGYTDAVANPPFEGMISAGGPSLYNDGRGCGTCYEIVCTENPACSGKPITVVITDECPGGPCASDPVHFDLSGTAIGALAKPGQDGNLRAAGILNVEYSRSPCSYPGTNIAFRMDPGANPYYMAFVVVYGDGDGNLAAVEIQPAGKNYMAMQEMRSAEWKLNSGDPLTGPFNVRLTSGVSGKVVEANAVIPENWKPGDTYRSVVNF
ncbi:PREDICTED: expansin-B4-like [Tarenaya hassleriana]|uniref:expansin-B4-like n=1 Tax=Tarenaya hassleriana TaxID=28532 RepID=UPI00053C23B3|nr:PREDICTED: expansin-B4-like [Tarenaya hassleriana]